MIIVGELINASRKAVRQAMEERDDTVLAELAVGQVEAGADYIDVNAGVFVGREAELLSFAVEVVQKSSGAVCCIDSPDPKAIESALAIHQGSALINSISLEKERYEAMLPLVAGTGLKVVALCMSDEGMPETADQRLHIADKLINSLVKAGVAIEDIYVDPLVQPVATNVSYGFEFLAAVERIMSGYPGVHTMCGLSNISYGLPVRKLMNRTFMAMAMSKGLDGAILNPMDKEMMAIVRAADALRGRDRFCMEYLKAFRAGLLE